MLDRILKSPWFMQRQVDAWLPWVFLLIALPTSYLIWQNEKHNAYMEQQIRFEYHARETASLIKRHLMEYEHMLDGIQSFFRASNYVSQDEFNDYVGALLQPNRLSSLRSLAFAKYVDASRPESYSNIGIGKDWKDIAKRMTPFEARNVYAPVIYAAPDSSLLLAPNQNNVMLDVLAESSIREVLNKSADLNAVIASPVMQSIQGGKIDDSFLMQLPIYQNNKPNQNLTQRRAHIDGWILATIHSEQFFYEAIQTAEKGLLAYKLYDITNSYKNTPIYQTQQASYQVDQHTPMFDQTYPIKAMGYEWKMRVVTLPNFEQSLDYKRANYIGLLGVFVSLALSGVLYLLVARNRAADTIHRVSDQLSVSEQRWQFALEGAGDGVWDWDITTNKVIFSKRWKAMLGYEEHEVGDDVNEWKSRVHPEDYVSVITEVEATLKGLSKVYSNEHRVLCKDGSWKWILDRGMVVIRCGWWVHMQTSQALKNRKKPFGNMQILIC